MNPVEVGFWNYALHNWQFWASGVIVVAGVWSIYSFIDAVDEKWPDLFKGKRWKAQQRRKNGHREPV